MKLNFNNETLPFSSKPKYLGVTLDRSLTYRRHLESLCKKLTLRVALLRQLAGSGWGAVATTVRTVTIALVHSTPEYCAPFWYHSASGRLIDPPSTTPCEFWLAACVLHQRKPFNPRRHPGCWISSQWSHTVYSKPFRGAWSSTPLSAHPSSECRCTTPQMETPICTRRTATHQSIWQKQHTCCAVGRSPMECGVSRQPHNTPHFHPRHRQTPRRDLPKKCLRPD